MSISQESDERNITHRLGKNMFWLLFIEALIQLRKRKALRKQNLHGKIAASVLLKHE